MNNRTRLTLTLVLLLCGMFFTTAAAATTHESLDRLLMQFDKTSGRHRTALANEVMSLLLSKGFGDDLKFGDDADADTVTMSVSYYAAEYYLSAREYDRCIAYALRALPLSEGNGDFTWQSESLNLLAQASFYKSDFMDALHYAEQMYSIDSSHGDLDRMSSTLNTIASIYLAANQAEQAREYSLRAIEADRQCDDHTHRTAILGVAADIHQRLGEYRQAMDYARRAYDIDRAAGSPKAAIRQTQMAAAALSSGDTAQARRLLDEALPVLADYQLMPSLGICYTTYGHLTALGGPAGVAASRTYYQKAYDLFSQSGDLYNQLHALHGLYLSTRDGDPQQAFRYVDQYTRLRDSVYSHEVQSLLCYYATRFHQDELLSQIHSDLHSRHYLMMGLSLGLLLLVVIGLQVWIVRRRRAVVAAPRQLIAVAEPPASAPEAVATEPSSPTAAPSPAVAEPRLADGDNAPLAESEADRKFIGQLTNAVCAQMGSGNIDIDKVASAMGLSPSQLRRRVSTVTGKSPSTYIMQIRLSNAQRLLDKHPELTIGEVAFKCGFSDNSHFSHAFQKMYGISPTQYLRRAK